MLPGHVAGRPPYRYRLSTRHEIPCSVSVSVSVSGSVIADGRSFEFTDVAGQRDHSWAARDWWSMEWVWSALHLDDGTHLHGLDLRIPGELRRQRLTAEYHARDGAGRRRRHHRRPGHAPLLLTADDGRVSSFPRAWATARTTDGRTGVGGLEWNRNQS